MVESGPSGTTHFFKEKMADKIARCQFHERSLIYCHFGTCGPVAFYILKWRAFKEKVKRDFAFSEFLCYLLSMPIVGSNILTCMASKKIFLPIIMNSLPAIKMFTTRRGVIWAPLMAPGKPSHPGYSRRQGSSREHAIFVKESALVGFIMIL